MDTVAGVDPPRAYCFHMAGVGTPTAAIVLAAGSGTRAGAVHNKVFLPLAGRRVVSWSLQAFASVGGIDRFIMVIREADRPLAEETIDRELEDIDVEIVIGGKTRQQSELSALRYLAPAIAAAEISLVLIHDGARPLLSARLIGDVLAHAARHQAALPALQMHDIQRVYSDGVLDMSDPGTLLGAQTPQAFSAGALLAVYEQAEAEGFDGTDTVSCWQHYERSPVTWVLGDPRNIKITYPGDLFEAEQILRDARFHLD